MSLLLRNASTLATSTSKGSVIGMCEPICVNSEAAVLPPAGTVPGGDWPATTVAVPQAIAAAQRQTRSHVRDRLRSRRAEPANVCAMNRTPVRIDLRLVSLALHTSLL